MNIIKLARIALVLVAMMGVGCASPPQVGLYGSMPRSGDWAKAHRLTVRTEGLLSSAEPDLAKAEVLLRRAIEVDPTHGPAYLQLGLLLEQQHRIDEAILAYAWAERLMFANSIANQRRTQLLAEWNSDDRDPTRSK